MQYVKRKANKLNKIYLMKQNDSAGWLQTTYA